MQARILIRPVDQPLTMMHYETNVDSMLETVIIGSTLTQEATIDIFKQNACTAPIGSIAIDSLISGSIMFNYYSTIAKRA